jgi:hypothetical protein
MNGPVSKRWRTTVAAVSIALFGVGSAVLVGLPAQADTPAPPVTAFSAPLCAGQTDDDPRAAVGAVSDLTSVFGARLTEYNSGEVVALYDSYGDNSLDAYPAICGTRYVDGVGPVSEWMFCTDIFSHVCSGVNAAGELLDIDGDPIPGLEPKSGNSKLDADQEKLITWLIRHGHSYAGSGYYDWGTTTAAQDGATVERNALQTLIWCISDAPDPADARASEQERAQTCADSMPPAEQARLLAQIPDDPTVTIAFGGSGTTLAIGQTADLELTTNLYDQPITLDVSGVTGDLAVASGPAVYDSAAHTLTITGADPTVTTTVRLGFTGTSAGTLTMTATAQPVSRTQIAWSQSPGVSADEKPCQVFATFQKAAQLAVADTAEATFQAGSTSTQAPTSTGTGGRGSGGTTTTLAETGSGVSPALPLGAALLIAGGALTIAMHHRRARA